MSLIGKVLNTFSKREVEENTVDKPIPMKPFSNRPDLLLGLECLLPRVTNKEKREWIERDLNLLKYGLIGEGNVNFEIMYSEIPMFTFHDVRLKHGDLVANIDFILMSKTKFYILETKRLSGDIRIDDKGNFIRRIKDYKGELIKEEGMYNPITQVKRHAYVLHKLLVDNEYDPDIEIIPLVVIANPKTIIRMDLAPKEIVGSIVKCDLLGQTLRKCEELGSEFYFPEDSMDEMTEIILNHNVQEEFDYKKKYSLISEDFKILNEYKLENPPPKSPSKANVYISTNSTAEKENNCRDLTKALKEYRWKESRRRNISPYIVFNDEEMKRLVDMRPTTIEILSGIKGFRKRRIDSYGEGIVEIIRRYT